MTARCKNVLTGQQSLIFFRNINVQTPDLKVIRLTRVSCAQQLSDFLEGGFIFCFTVFWGTMITYAPYEKNTG